MVCEAGMGDGTSFAARFRNEVGREVLAAPTAVFLNPWRGSTVVTAVHLDAHGLPRPLSPGGHATAAFLRFPRDLNAPAEATTIRQVPDGPASTSEDWIPLSGRQRGGKRSRTDGSGGRPSQRRRTGSPARPTTQAEWLEALGLDIVDVDRNGDCLYASFLVIAGRYMLDHELMRDHRRAEPELRGWLDGGSAGEPPRSAVLALRRWVADRLAADFAAARAGSVAAVRVPVRCDVATRTATPAVVG